MAQRTQAAAALVVELKRHGLWPPLVPTPVLTECLTGSPARDANTNRFLKTCLVEPVVPERTARRAASLRTQARVGSAIDALVVAVAEPGGTVVTSDPGDINTLCSYAAGVAVKTV